MKSILRSFVMAFSEYSISPKSKMKRDKMNCSYILLFLPLIGIIITAVINRWAVYSPYMCEDGSVLPAIICVVAPIILSAGSHMDGFFKTVDALSSHKSRKEAIRIIREDNHCGHMAIIAAMCYFLLAVGIWNVIPLDGFYIVAFAYTISRALFGISLVTMKHMNGDEKGMNYVPDSKIGKIVVVAANLAYIAISAYLMIEISLTSYVGISFAIACLAGAAVAFVYYIIMSFIKFGGVSEELASFFVTLCEVAIPIAAICMFKSPI